MGYGPLASALRWGYRHISRRYQVVGEVPEGPVIWVCRHGGDVTPVKLVAWAPGDIRLWALDVLCERKHCDHLYADHTFSVRFGLPRPLASVLAWLCAGPVSALMQSLRVIPVSRGSWAIRQTLESTVEALCQGDSICLFPDVAYTETEGKVGKLYTGFLNLARMVYDRSGQIVPFLPVQVDHARREIRFGEPIVFDTARHFARQKGELSEKIAAAL